MFCSKWATKSVLILRVIGIRTGDLSAKYLFRRRHRDRLSREALERIKTAAPREFGFGDPVRQVVPVLEVGRFNLELLRAFGAKAKLRHWREARHHLCLLISFNIVDWLLFREGVGSGVRQPKRPIT